FQQIEQLQQATFHCEAGRSSVNQPTPAPELLLFDLAGCAANLILPEAREPHRLPREEQESVEVLNWRRTSKDPFTGQWEQILAWVQANPTRSGGDILRELQSRFPGRYECSHLRTLQRRLRKIRTYVLQTHEEAGPPEGLLLPSGEMKLTRPASESLVSSSFPVCEDASSPKSTSTHSSDPLRTAEEL